MASEKNTNINQNWHIEEGDFIPQEFDELFLDSIDAFAHDASGDNVVVHINPLTETEMPLDNLNQLDFADVDFSAKKDDGKDVDINIPSLGDAGLFELAQENDLNFEEVKVTMHNDDGKQVVMVAPIENGILPVDNFVVKESDFSFDDVDKGLINPDAIFTKDFEFPSDAQITTLDIEGNLYGEPLTYSLPLEGIDLSGVSEITDENFESINIFATDSDGELIEITVKLHPQEGEQQINVIQGSYSEGDEITMSSIHINADFGNGTVVIDMPLEHGDFEITQLSDLTDFQPESFTLTGSTDDGAEFMVPLELTEDGHFIATEFTTEEDLVLLNSNEATEIAGLSAESDDSIIDVGDLPMGMSSGVPHSSLDSSDGYISTDTEKLHDHTADINHFNVDGFESGDTYWSMTDDQAYSYEGIVDNIDHVYSDDYEMQMGEGIDSHAGVSDHENILEIDQNFGVVLDENNIAPEDFIEMDYSPLV